MGISPLGNKVSNFDDCRRFADVSCSLAAARLFEIPPSFRHPRADASCTRWWMALHASRGGRPHRSVGEVSFWHGVSLAYASYRPSLLVMSPTLGPYCRRLFSYDPIKQMIVCVSMCVTYAQKTVWKKRNGAWKRWSSTFSCTYIGSVYFFDQIRRRPTIGIRLHPTCLSTLVPILSDLLDKQL